MSSSALDLSTASRSLHTEPPKIFRERFATQFGAEEERRLYDALQEESPVSIRLHPEKLELQGDAELVPWCREGIYLPERPLFGADPWWHAGGYYVQEAGSMFLSQYLQQLSLHPSVALDLCAAPGGKSTLLRSGLPSDTLLVANEPEPARAAILRENLLRYGADETIVTSAYPEQLRKSGLRAEVILVDAPCSGEGMFRKEPDAVRDWSVENVAMCVARQQEILREAWQILEPGGVLIYSTCTYNREENEEQLMFLRGNYHLEVVTLRTSPEWNAVEGTEEGVYRFFPHRTRSEGFTIFAVRKIGDASTPHRWTKQKTRNIPNTLTDLDPDFLLRSKKSDWYFLSPKGQSVLSLLDDARIRLLLSGVELGQEKGRDFVPAHGWVASSRLLPSLALPTYTATPEEALAYLKRETLQIQTEKGHHILTYQGLPLGLLKQIGNRANNLYPKELAIRNQKLSVADMPSYHFLKSKVR